MILWKLSLVRKLNSLSTSSPRLEERQLPTRTPTCTQKHSTPTRWSLRTKSQVPIPITTPKRNYLKGAKWEMTIDFITNTRTKRLERHLQVPMHTRRNQCSTSTWLVAKTFNLVKLRRLSLLSLISKDLSERLTSDTRQELAPTLLRKGLSTAS